VLKDGSIVPDNIEAIRAEFVDVVAERRRRLQGLSRGEATPF
jgi:hypothetical protein